MCECLRGIFRVTWTPSSDADSDREDSHVFNRTKDPAVKDKRRSPPPRSPAGPQHGGLTDEQESPERTVQKEKLHAELKQVLSQKRSHLRESTCQLAQPEMDSEPTDEQAQGVEDDLRKSVEIVVETDAEVGASGYSVTGGGEHGIFVKDVLKDSPAAKHLSLQQGDQLLSAKVYFDNVRYEDALKILQCAEPYKVSFQLKRTVPETEVSVRPRIPGGDAKGPKAKVAKMSVKGTKLFKTQKRRGGRFGLKRLKEKNKEELVMEGTPPRLEAGDVDVEFSLPTFKQRKGVKEAEPVVGKGKKRIRFPHMKTKSYTGAVPGGKLGTGRLEVDENIFPPETSGAEVKTKGKGHKFGIAFPKSKHTKSGSASQTGSLERKPPEVRIHPPSVEFDVSSVKEVEKRGLKLKSPDVEFALTSGKAGGSVSTVKETSESKAPKGDVRREADATGGKVHADISKGDAKLRMPKLKLPKVRLSRHSDEIDSAFQVKAPKAEMKGDDKMQLPEGSGIRMPKVEGDLSGGAASVQIPSIEISLPKVKGTFDADVSLPESGVKAGVKMPDVKVSGSEMDLELNAKQKIPDEVEGMFKGPKISMPKVDISLPKTGSAGVKGPDVGGKISLPSVDISLPQMKSGGGDVDMGCYVGGDGKFKMPEFDPTFPDMKSSEREVEGTFKIPKVDLNLPKGKAGATDDDRAAFQLPSMEVSLPKMKRNKVEVSTKGGKLKMPEVEFSPPKGNIQGGFEVEGQAGKEGKFKMPTVDVSMPKLKQAEGHIEGPEMMSGGEIQLPSHDASLPTSKMKGNTEIEVPSAKGGKFTMPSVNIKLPQMGSTEAGVDLHGQKMEVASEDVSLKPMGDIEGKVKGGKFTLPSVDISLPKMKLPKGDVILEGPDLNLSLPSSGNKVKGDSDGGKFKMPTCDISLQKGKIKEEEGNIRGPEVKGEKFQMPSFDVSLPQIKKRGGDIDVELPKLKGGEIKAPTIEISAVQRTPEGDFDLESDGKEGEFSLHGMKFPEGGGNFQGPKVKGAKFEMPKIDLSLPRGKSQGAFHTEIHSGKDGNIEMASCDFDVPKGELCADINVDGLERKTDKFKMPKIDISLPKLNLPEGEVKFEGPETKGHMEKPSLDITPPEGKLNVDVDGRKAKGSKFHMPTININLPKIKSKDVSIDVKGPEGEEGKLPSCDITQPDNKFPEADVSLGGPNVKGGQIHVPGVEASLPETNGKVGISVETPEGNLEKLQMPKFDIAMPKVNFPDSAGKMTKSDLKIKKMEMADSNVPLPKGKTEANIEIDGGKGKKFHIPSVDFSLPRIKTKGSEVKTGGVEGKFQMPDTDVSLSEGKVEVDTNIQGPEIKGGKFKMPKFDISFPNKNLSEGKQEVDISITQGKIQEDVDLSGKLPTMDFSPPKMQAKELHVDIKPLETTNLDISSPKVALPAGNSKIEGPHIKRGKIEMPDIDLSLTKGKAKGDIETTGSSHKGGKFHVPAIDITLPKMKSKGAEVHVESPEVKGGQIKMPSIDVSGPKLKSPGIDVSLKGPEVEGKIKKSKGDISLPKGEVQGDVEVEGPDMKGGKFKMPKFDVSLPKVSLPKFDASIEGPDLKGNAEMPSVNISVPKATTNVGVDVDTGKGSKFHMPSLDISLPKMKAKGFDVNVEGLEVKGDISLPEVKSPDVDFNLQGPEVKGGKHSLPKVDITLPKTEGNFEVEGPDMKGGKFKMPKFDVSLPKVSLPKFDASVEGPDLKGKAEMPSVDISVPKGTTDLGVDVDTGKGSKFHMPSLDISLPKMKAKGFDVNVEGPEVKGDKSLPEVKSPDVDFNLQGPELKGGKLSLPNVDIALPKTEGDVNIEGPDMKGGKFKMPKFDVSLPKVSLPKFDASVEGPDLKGKAEMPSVDISVPKGTTDLGVVVDTGKDSNFHMPSLDISLPKMKTKGLNVNVEGPEVKGDISLPEIKSPDVDFNLQGPEVKGGKLSLPKVDVALPKTEGDFEVEGPDMKGGKFKMPKLPKVSLPEEDVKVKGPDINVGKIEMPAIDISLPKGKAKGDAELEGHTGKRGKFHMPVIDIYLPKIKTKEPETHIKGPEVKGGKIPDIDFSLPRGEVDADLNLEGPEKRGQLKTPKVDVSLPNFELKVGGKVEGIDVEGNTDKTNTKISFPEEKSKGNVNIEGHSGKTGKFHLPSIDFSLPKIKVHGTETEGLECKSEISIPKENLQGTLNVEGSGIKESECTTPTFDASLPKFALTGGDSKIEGPRIKRGKIEMPDIDLSLTKGKAKGDIETTGCSHKGGKFHMPAIDITLPKMKSKGAEVHVESPEVKGGQIKMPSLDVSGPKLKSPNIDVSLKGPEVEGKIKKPMVDISLPKGEVQGDFEIEGPDIKGGKFKIPKFDVSLPRVSLPKFDANVEGPDLKGNAEMPSVNISVPKATTDVALPKTEGNFEVEGPDMKGGKFKMPRFDVSLPKVSLPKFDAGGEGPGLKGKAEMPSVDISVPKGTADLGVDEDTSKGSKFHMPSLDISLPKMKTKGLNVNVEGPEVKGDKSLPKVKSPDVDFNLQGPEVKGGKLSLPNVDIALPKTEGDVDIEGLDIKGGKFKMPKFDVSLPKVSLPKFDASVEGPDLKGKAEMPSVDISVPKGTTDLGVDVDTGKGSKFHMPSLDISPPKMKAKGFDVNVEGPEVKGDISLPEVKSPDVDFNLQRPEVKGGKLSLPKVDVASPKTEGDFEVEGPDMKGGKFKMPKFDVSLPKVSLPKFDASVEGPDLKGKAEMPSVDISVPKGTTDLGVVVDTGKGSKFHMPSLDISFPKMKTKGLNVNVEGPEVKGDMPLPKIKTPVTDVNLQSPEVERGDVNMPTLDVLLPKPEGDFEIQGPEVKGGKYKMSKLPKVSLPEEDVKVKGSDIHFGKIEMPDIDISLPKGKAKGDAELEGHTGKRGKFHMPVIDISLPKIKTKEPEIHIKGPEVKGGKIPDIDFSLPRGEVDADLNLEGPEKRGQLKMPKVDVSLPQIKLAGDVIVEGPEVKGKITEPAVDFSKGEGKMKGDIKKGMGLHMPSIDLHLPKVDLDLSLPSGSKGQGIKADTSGPDASADVQMSGIKGQLKPPKIKATDASINTGGVDNPGASLKLPTVKLPTVDISAPKVDLDFGLTKSTGDEVEVQLLKAEGGRPLSGGSFDLPDVSLKAPSFTFPRFGGKSKSSELQISKSEVSISPPDVEGEVKTPSVECDDEGKVKVKKNKIKIPSFGLSRKDPDVSVSCPEVDVKGKKENIDIPTQKIGVEGSSDKTKYKVKLPKFKISSPIATLPEKEGDVKVEADGKGGFHAPDVTIKLPKFSMPGFGSKEKDLGKPVGEIEVKTKLKMPSVELSLPETKTPDTEVLLPKAEVDVSEADIRGYEGNLKVPKMPKIDVSIPKIDPDVPLPKGKSQKIEKPDMDVKGEGKFKIPQIKMPSLDIDIPKGKSVSPDVEVDVDRGKFNMPYVKMPSVDITLPKPKTGKALDVDAEGDGKLQMPDIKMPNVNISKGANNKLEGTNVDIQGRGKLKTADVYASDLETPDGKMEWDSERRFKMPSVDISLPKGKLKGNSTPDMELGIQGEGKVKLPHMKMPDFDVSFPKIRTKDSQMEIKDKGGKLKTPNVSTPPIDISLSTGKDVEVEEISGGKFKMPHWKRPDVDIPLPKGHMEGPEVELTGERGGLKMPHISLPSVDISLPKGRADAPQVERGDGEEKFTTLYMTMPSVDPNVQLKGEGPKFQMPHVNMPNIEFSLPKGKDIPKLKTEGEEGKVKMPSVDISIPTGKIPCPDAEAEGGQGPYIKMPHVNITLPKGKSDKSEGAELETEGKGKSNISPMTLPSVDISLPRGQTKDYSPDIKGERKKFKMGKEDFSLPKGRSYVEGLDVDIKEDPSMAAAKAEGGHIKLPHMKFPKVDISLPKGRSKGTSSPAIEMDVTGPEGNMPKVPSSKAEIQLPTVEAQGKLKVPQGAHLDSSSEGDHASLKLKTPTVEIKSPKEDLELQTGSHKEEGNKNSKKIELPDLDLTLEGSGGKGKGTKNKGAKFKIRKHKKKTGKDISAKPQSEEEAGEQVKHNSNKDGVNVQLPGVTPPTVTLKTKKCDVGGSSPSTAEGRVPRIPDIEFDIGTSQDEEDGQAENKIKIPKFGIPLPSISSPERLAHGPEVQYEGPKIPKVKKAVFVLVNPSEPDDSVPGPSLQKEQTKAETETEEATVKISKKKPSFGKSKDKSATESAERKVEEEEMSRGLKMKMPKVKFSAAKSGSFGVKGDSSSPSGGKDASPHKDDKGTFGGKLKLPKVELTSPYGKMAAGEENKGARFQKDSSLVEVKTEFRGLPAPAESAGDVVTSHARTEMLDRDSSESPDGLEFSSAKVQMWSESKEAEERESSSWFKVPKVTLKPLSSGFLQITPEGSPQAQRKGEVAGMEDVSGSFCIHTSGLDFAAQQMSEEHHVSASEEGTVTMVTKTTRITRQIVSSQTHTAESSKTTSCQVSDSNF